MSEMMIIYTTITLLLILFFMRMPVGTALLFAAIYGLTLMFGVNQASSISASKIFGHLNRFALISLPLFMLMGNILAKGGLGHRLFNIFESFLGHINGGVGMGTVLTCALLEAMMGSSVALAASMAPFAIKNLYDLGYDADLSAGIITGSATLGLLIPPSGVMILFGVMTDASIGQCFMAGFVPGFMMAGFFCVYVWYRFKKSKTVRVQEKQPWLVRWKALKEGYMGLVIPTGIIVSIYTGIATATEAASIGCILAILGACLIHRTLPWKELPKVLYSSAVSVGGVLLVMAGAVAFASFVLQSGLSLMISNIFAYYKVSVWVFYAIIIGIMLIEGMFLTSAAIILIMVPILHSTILYYNIPLVLICIVMTICCQMAQLTPPVGMTFFIVHNILKELELEDFTLNMVIKGGLPFFAIIVFSLILVLLFPQIALWLPSTMY